MAEQDFTTSIENLSDRMISRQSFSYASFADARHTITSTLGEVEFDRITLSIYRSTLSSQHYSDLIRLIKKKRNVFRKEEAKKREEYCVLLRYFLTAGISTQSGISKAERPDFECIINDESVGIEITKMEQETTAIRDKIITRNFGKGLTAKEIYEDAQHEFGEKAERYRYSDLKVAHKNIVAVYCKGMQDINKAKADYAKIIDSKLVKYRNANQQYSHFIILCDGYQQIAITEERDAQDIISLLHNPIPSNTQIAILYDAQEGTRLFVTQLAGGQE